MKTRSAAKLLACALAATLLTSVTSCAALTDYSRRVGRNACRSAGTCTVYDQTGAHQEPCWPTMEGQMAYPGDPDWPFEHGVCDTVEQMNAEWPDPGTSATASTSTTAGITAGAH